MQQTPKEKVIFIQWFLFGLVITSLIFTAFVIPYPARASTFPNDAETIGIRNETGVDNLNTLLLATSTTPTAIRTILAVASQTQSAREVTLYCGSNANGTATVFFDTMISTNTSFQRFMQVKCNKAIYIDNMRTSFTGMTYVDYDLALAATSTPVTVTLQSASTTTAILNGFSYGEIMQVLLLLMIFTLGFFAFLHKLIFGVRVENPQKIVQVKKMAKDIK